MALPTAGKVFWIAIPEVQTQAVLWVVSGSHLFDYWHHHVGDAPFLWRLLQVHRGRVLVDQGSYLGDTLLLYGAWCYIGILDWLGSGQVWTQDNHLHNGIVHRA